MSSWMVAISGVKPPIKSMGNCTSVEEKRGWEWLFWGKAANHRVLLIPVSHPVLIIATAKSVMSKRTDTFFQQPETCVDIKVTLTIPRSDNKWHLGSKCLWPKGELKPMKKTQRALLPRPSSNPSPLRGRCPLTDLKSAPNPQLLRLPRPNTGLVPARRQWKL